MCTINVHAIYALLQTPYKLICCTTLPTRLSLSSNKLQSLSSNLFLILPFDITHFTFLGDKSIESISNPSATLRIYTYSQPDTGFIHAVENIHHTGSTILPLHLQQHYHCTNDCAKVHTGIVASNNSRPE